MLNKPKKILLTGGTGLIGSQLLERCGADNHIYAISREGSVEGATKTLNIDLSDNWSVDELPTDVDVIVHLAQSNNYRDFPDQALDVFAVNTQSTVRLLDYAKNTGVQQFVLASSGGVYGTGGTGFSEDDAIIAKGELGYYIATRLCSEILSENYTNYFNVVCLRFFFAYGASQRSQMLIPRLVNSVKTGQPITLQGDEGLIINPVHVSDAVKAVEKAMGYSGSQKINVAGSEQVSLREIAETIGRFANKKPQFEVTPFDGKASLVADIEKMKLLLHCPEVSLADGIQTFFDG